MGGGVNATQASRPTGESRTYPMSRWSAGRRPGGRRPDSGHGAAPPARLVRPARTPRRAPAGWGAAVQVVDGFAAEPVATRSGWTKITLRDVPVLADTQTAGQLCKLLHQFRAEGIVARAPLIAAYGDCLAAPVPRVKPARPSPPDMAKVVANPVITRVNGEATPRNASGHNYVVATELDYLHMLPSGTVLHWSEARYCIGAKHVSWSWSRLRS